MQIIILFLHELFREYNHSESLIYLNITDQIELIILRNAVQYCKYVEIINYKML